MDKRHHLLAFFIAGIWASLAIGQPDTLILKAKLRDFKEATASDPVSHPDFENDDFLDCGGAGLGYVAPEIGLSGELDSLFFSDDNREPVLVKLNHPNSGKPCYSSFDAFHDWYNDNPDRNRSFYTQLALTSNGNGTYSYTNLEFFPLDDRAGWQKGKATDPDPFGPIPGSGLNHVFGFTLELHSIFTYIAGQGQTFSFSGDDDVWVFINGKLVIDLGGLHPRLDASVNLDQKASELALVNGGNYKLDFFFAERHSTASRLQISTSLKLLQTLPIPQANPPGQTYRDSIGVGLSVPRIPEAILHYTLDGSEPTEASPIYSTPLVLKTTTTLKVRAYHPDYNPSPVLTEVYALQPPPPPPVVVPPPPVALPIPIANPSGTAFHDSITIQISVPGHPLVAIHYTLDGSEPTLSSPIYNGSLSIKNSMTVKAKAWELNWLPSPILIEPYQLVPPPNVIALTLKQPISRSTGSSLLSSLPNGTPPISIVAGGSEIPICLACPPGTEILSQSPSEFPEWNVTSREPFQYEFSIFDNLANFVLQQKGEVTQAMLDQAPANLADGYRSLRFRWIPVAQNGRLIGTGAYILRARVMSPTHAAKGEVGSTSSFTKTLGFIRQD